MPVSLKWGTLKNALDHPILARGYIWIAIVPAIANILHKFPDVVEIQLSPNSVIRLTSSLPFNWYVLYLSAILAYLAYGLYAIFCPKFLANYRSAGEALQAGLTTQYLIEAQQDFIRNYFSNTYNPTKAERSFLERIFTRLRLNNAKFYSQHRNPSGENLADILSQFSIITDNEGSVYHLSDGSLVLRDQFFKHLYHDLIRLQEVCFPKFRLMASLLLYLAIALSVYVLAQGASFVLSLFLGL